MHVYNLRDFFLCKTNFFINFFSLFYQSRNSYNFLRRQDNEKMF